jgi:hypothetical protein
LYLNENSGNSSAYAISNINKITFQSGNLVIETKSATDSFAITGIRSLSMQQLVTGVDGIVKETQNLSAYPNPCSDVLNISDVTSNLSYFIHDLSGSLVQSDKVSSIIDVSNLTTGVYFLTVVGGDDIRTLKFIKL